MKTSANTSKKSAPKKVAEHPYIHFSQPIFGPAEKKELMSALDSGWVTLGPRTKQFEDDFASYVGSKYAVGVSSCTAALHLALLAAGVKAGDEVITSAFTFIATVNAIIHSGATPVIVDIEPDTYNISPEAIEKAITRKTKVIMPVDYGGHPADYTAIMKIAKKHNLVVIEDAACGGGGIYKNKKIGAVADMTCFSFHPIKSISTGDGGMITTNNKAYDSFLRTFRLHGMSKEAWKRYEASGSWMFEVVGAGFKYNMFDLQAALGIHQLKKLEKFIAIREKYAQKYNKALSKLPEVTVPTVRNNARHARNIYTLKIDFSDLNIDRNTLVDMLKKAHIGVSVYYIPVYVFEFYQKKFGWKSKNYPVTHELFENMLSLPLYPGMKIDDVNYIIRTLSEIIISNRK